MKDSAELGHGGGPWEALAPHRRRPTPSLPRSSSSRSKHLLCKTGAAGPEEKEAKSKAKTLLGFPGPRQGPSVAQSQQVQGIRDWSSGPSEQP